MPDTETHEKDNESNMEEPLHTEEADLQGVDTAPAEEQQSEPSAGEPEEITPEEADSTEDEITTPAVLEAILFAADEPVAPTRLAEIIGTCGVKKIREHIDELNDKYEQMDCSFRVEAIAGGYQMLTQPRFNPWLSKLIKVRGQSRLTPAALETLAIIAYKQPVLRIDVEAIRGVGAGEMIRQLSEKGLTKIVGRAEVLGRPLLYGTTKKFLETFGLNSLKDLPTAEDLKKP